MQGQKVQEVNDVRNSYKSREDSMKGKDLINLEMANAPPSGQPNDYAEEIEKVRNSYLSPHSNKNDLSENIRLEMPDGSTYEGTIDQETK